MPIAGSTHDAGKCFIDAVNAFATHALAADKTVTCTETNLGFYQAKAKWEYDKNGGWSDLVIYAPNGKLKYRIKGSW